MQAAGSLDALVADPTLAGNPKLAGLIEQYGEQACLCRAVSIVRRDLPLSIDWESSRYDMPPERDLYQLYSELEFKTLLAKLEPPSDLPLFERGTKLSGKYRSYEAGGRSPRIHASRAKSCKRSRNGSASPSRCVAMPSA